MPGDCSFPLSPSIFDAHNSFVILYLVAKTIKKLEIIFVKSKHQKYSTLSYISLYEIII